MSFSTAKGPDLSATHEQEHSAHLELQLAASKLLAAGSWSFVWEFGALAIQFRYSEADLSAKRAHYHARSNEKRAQVVIIVLLDVCY